MKKNLLIIILIFCFDNFYGQYSFNIDWQKSWGGTAEDFGNDIKTTTDGGFITICTTRSTDQMVLDLHGYNFDAWVVKSDALGNVIWKKCYGGTKDDYGKSIIQTSDGGYLFVADTKSNDGDLITHYGLQTKKDVWVVKLDSNGNLIWQKNIGGSNDDEAHSVLEVDDGYLVIGETYSSDFDFTINRGNNDAFASKLNLDGVLMWSKTYGGGGGEYMMQAIKNSNGTFTILGGASSRNGDLENSGYHMSGSGVFYGDLWLINISAEGELLRSKCFGSFIEDNGHTLTPSHEGGFILAGTTTSNGGDVSGFRSVQDIWIAKIDANWNIIWQRCYGGSAVESPAMILQDHTGGYVFAGSTSSNNFDVTGNHPSNNNSFSNDIWLVKIAENGDISWQRCLGGSAGETANGLTATANGKFALIGNTTSRDGDVIGRTNTGQDIWVLQVQPATLSVDNNSFFSKIFILSNPVKEDLIIQSDNKILHIKITDLSGRLIYQTKENIRKINLGKMSSGTYLIEFTTANGINRQKFIKT